MKGAPAAQPSSTIEAPKAAAERDWPCAWTSHGTPQSTAKAIGVVSSEPKAQVSVAFHGYLAGGPIPVAGGDARATRWVAVSVFLAIETAVAFDHRVIVGDAIRRRFGSPAVV